MKKKLIAMSASVLMMAMLALPAWAMANLTDPKAVLPVDIIVDQEAREIRKVYDLSPNMDPSALPMDSFLRDGVQYECDDVLREVVIGTETKTVTQEESEESDKKDMETILGLFPQEKEITTEKGYTGTVRLDLDSIKTEPAGYGSSTRAVTTTRSYPNLASADMNHLPKTVTEGGKTYTLQDVQWQTDNTYNTDDYEIGDRFTAICTYGGTKTSSYVTGYVTKANYVGEVHRLHGHLHRHAGRTRGLREPRACGGARARPHPLGGGHSSRCHRCAGRRRRRRLSIHEAKGAYIP